MNYVDLEMPKAGDTVVVGLSGGVDSTMTAVLLKEKGCKVIGVTMSLWRNTILNLPEGETPFDSCYSPKENINIEECRKFCAEQEIEYKVIDVKDEYEKKVLEYFKEEYRAGRTPNPCVQCNRFIKFGALLEGIKKLGIEYDYFCTGHYARIVRGTEGVGVKFGAKAADVPEKNNRPAQVCVAMDLTKDQAYFLNRIPSEILEKVRFPMAHYNKSEIFEMARKKGLAAADREESQDFIPSAYVDVLFNDKPSVPGDVIDLDGKVLGKHRGIEHYTIGQRRGLGISAPYPLYVAAIDKEKNLVVLGKDSDLFCSGLICDDMVWPGNYDPDCEFEAMVKIRLASRPVKALISPYVPLDGEVFTGKAWKVIFSEPQRAVAPGQAVVFYMDSVTSGSGIICKSIKS